MRIHRLQRVVPTLLLAIALASGSAGCGCGSSGGSGGGGTQPAQSAPLVQPDFQALDVNPSSPTHQTPVSPRQHQERISAWFFGRATDPYHQAQFQLLNALQADPALAGLLREVVILGVNAMGHESGNASMCTGCEIPWLQDAPGQSGYAAWQAQEGELVILDAENRIAAILDLLTNDLAVEANYDRLRSLLIHLASLP